MSTDYTAPESLEAGHWRPGRPNRPGRRLRQAIAAAQSPHNRASAEVAPLENGSPEEIVIDLRPQTAAVEVPARTTETDYGLGRSWGSEWNASAQGWVDRCPSGSTWRPVVTTTDDVPQWGIDTYLGVIAGESAVESHLTDSTLLGAALAEGREISLHGLIEAAVARGAHAVIGVNLGYTQVGGRLIITSSGTAVTLRERSQARR